MAMELNNAFSTSVEAFLLSKHKMYSITVASQGNVILPSSLVNPNSSPEILRSSLKTVFPRYTNGTSNRVPSAVYMMQWPLPATAVEHPSASFDDFMASRFLLRAAILSHLFVSDGVGRSLNLQFIVEGEGVQPSSMIGEGTRL
ncbi:hypothetical protein C2845_PM04G23160 [Panicum miliaceum]|uniref:Uncharacterized protein n=1 Tax=Panicum miliaceum TaxID=4540 RepID=A0A3L6QTC8_PANMI|nr:hypothetical protein C2845_PM04G23160 [Panicum miliaceum]